MTSQSPIFEAINLSKTFVVKNDFLATATASLTGKQVEPQMVRAVDNISLSLKDGETLGIVGESGCGKSTLARMIAGISSATSGSMKFKGRDFDDVLANKSDALKIQMIFQDPMSSLNPRHKVVDIVGEGAVTHGIVKRSEMREYVTGILKTVGLGVDHLDRFPHQFSGGQRQRIGIARALAVKPEMLICDEAVAALDVSVQAQIANLFMDIRQATGLSMLFISHDLSVIRHICDKVVVMYLGRVVEIADTQTLFEAPAHPYTRMLLDGMPKISLERREFMPIRGEIPSPLDPPSGCHFNPRCSFATEQCRSTPPELVSDDRGGQNSCLNYGSLPDV